MELIWFVNWTDLVIIIHSLKCNNLYLAEKKAHNLKLHNPVIIKLNISKELDGMDEE